jgi:hypothetical protein
MIGVIPAKQISFLAALDNQEILVSAIESIGGPPSTLAVASSWNTCIGTPQTEIAECYPDKFTAVVAILPFANF